LADLAGRMDRVLVDAPCTGSGTWRRAPDAKWRVRPGALVQRRKEQAEALALAAPLVRPGGRLVYVTCSVLPAENEGALESFLGAHPDFVLVAADKVRGALLPEATVRVGRFGLQLTPARTGCDGFFIGVMERIA
ncbi:MAG: MFS transporter, partial [Hyphomonadaceae bacterium]|nr:MFS transporter [Hyphomonadaceae bacterium]